jgi:hypothetical protein
LIAAEEVVLLCAAGGAVLLDVQGLEIGVDGVRSLRGVHGKYSGASVSVECECEKRIPFGNDGQRGRGEGKSKGTDKGKDNSKGKYRSRFPAGMTTKKARATATAKARAAATAKTNAGPSTSLRFAQDDGFF